MIKTMTALAACLLVMFGVCQARETVVEIVAVVNNEAITDYQLDRRIEELRRETPAEAPLPKLRQKALDSLIEESLLRQRAEELGMEVSDEELQAAISDIRQQNDLTMKQLESALEAQGVTMEEYREQLREQIIRYKVIGREMRERSEITSEDVREYFRTHIDDYRRSPTVRLSHITVAVPEGATKQQAEKARKMAEKAVERIQGGENFTDVFLDLSADPAVSGGDMGSFAAGELAPVFDRAVRELEKGEVSSAVKFQNNYYIFRVEEREPGEIRKFDQVKEEIREKLLEENSEDQLGEWKKELRQKAYVEIR